MGQMKGEMLKIDDSIRFVDLTHDIPPQDILEGAFQLATAIRAFPAWTVHLAVVDPGVGSERRAIVVETRLGTFVGPDNGLFTFAYHDGIVSAYELSSRRVMKQPASTTFHGRDIFAPFAAAIASGAIDIAESGPPIDPLSLKRLCLPAVVADDQTASGPIVSIDRFGNCLTIIRPGDMPGNGEIESIVCREFRVERIANAFSDVAKGDPVAVIGSFGTLELARRDGSAARHWGLQRGDLITIHARSAEH